jgi:hypothetical protein
MKKRGANAPAFALIHNFWKNQTMRFSNATPARIAATFRNLKAERETCFVNGRLDRALGILATLRRGAS